MRADMSANLAGMTTNPRKRAGKQSAQPALVDNLPMTAEARRERAKAANAALTTEQRQAAGRARAAMLHHPTTLARRIGKAWPDLSDEDRRAVRRALREAGIIK